MINKKHWFILFFLISFLFSNTNIPASDSDSLKELLKTKLPDTTRVTVLNALSKSYFNVAPDTSVKIANSSKELAEKINFKPGLALALKNMGIAYYLQGNYIDAINTWQKALEVYKSNGDKVGVANMLSNQGAVYFNQGDDDKSLELHLQSLKMSEDVNDTLRIVTSLTNIGAIYLNKSATYKKAIDNFKRAYTLSKLIDDKYMIGTSAVNLGELYYRLNDDSTAMVYLNEAQKAYAGTEDLPYALNYQGRVYVRQKEYSKAIETHLEALNISEKLDTKLDKTQSLVGLAQAYLAKGDLGLAIKRFLEAVDIGKSLNANMEVKDAYEGLAQAYSQKNDYSNAFKYQNLLLSIKDTIYNINTDKKLGTLQFTFDLEKKESQINLLTKDKVIQDQTIKRQKLIRNGFVGGFLVVGCFAFIFFGQRNRISKEKKRSDELLLNILPEETAEELKLTGTAQPQSFDLISVMFTDFKGFTQLSEKLSAKELVNEINECFSAFDHIMTKYGVEKIKTIGDAYMAAGGLPTPNQTHAVDVVNAAIEVREFMDAHKAKKAAAGQLFFEIRIGVHTGPVVAGIVGVKKFAYDIWGDTVNTASRMESSGEIGKVNISGTTYEMVKDKFKFQHRGKIQAKGKGEIDMYFVEK